MTALWPYSKIGPQLASTCTHGTPRRPVSFSVFLDARAALLQPPPATPTPTTGDGTTEQSDHG